MKQQNKEDIQGSQNMSKLLLKRNGYVWAADIKYFEDTFLFGSNYRNWELKKKDQQYFKIIFLHN